MLMPVTPVEGAEEYGAVGCKWLAPALLLYARR
jgi:hypothetical protein